MDAEVCGRFFRREVRSSGGQRRRRRSADRCCILASHDALVVPYTCRSSPITPVLTWRIARENVRDSQLRSFAMGNGCGHTGKRDQFIRIRRPRFAQVRRFTPHHHTERLEIDSPRIYRFPEFRGRGRRNRLPYLTLVISSGSAPFICFPHEAAWGKQAAFVYRPVFGCPSSYG